MPPTDRPQRIPSDHSELALTTEETFVLGRIDGRLTVEDLGDLTGIEPERVETIVESLTDKGAVEIPGATPVREARRKSWRPDVAVTGAPPTEREIGDLGEDGEEELWERGFEMEWPTGEEGIVEEGARRGGREGEGGEGEGQEVAEAEGRGGEGREGEAREGAGQEDEERGAGTIEPMRYRRLFEAKFRALDPEMRVHLALTASAEELFAFAFDPDPGVIAAVLANAVVGLGQARFIATWHGTPAGLDMIAKKAGFIQDGGIKRRLVRNTHTSEALLRRILEHARMVEIHGTAMDRDVPELARTRARGILRARFTRTAQPEERVELIVKTEGRCLQLLAGCTFDGRTTQALASRQYASIVFIRNLARFPATPPTLLAHLLKQPMVRRNPAIRKMLLQHKNTPPEAKKGA